MDLGWGSWIGSGWVGAERCELGWGGWGMVGGVGRVGMWWGGVGHGGVCWSRVDVVGCDGVRGAEGG